jgi:glycosyltransferase involved in cell wall biosynthesis
MYRKAFELHKSENFSIVHCRSYLPGMIGRLLKKKNPKLKFIFDMRGFWIDERVEGNIWNLKNPIYRTIFNYFKIKEKQLFREADAVISLTEIAIPIIKKIRGNSVRELNYTVIPCCVDTNKFNFNLFSDEDIESKRHELGIDKNDYVLIYLGSISTWYLPEEMLDFYKVLIQRKNNTKFLIITQEDPTWLIKLAETKNIPTDQLIIKSANRNEVPSLINVSNGTVFFIKQSFSKMASSPTKKAELMSMGIPIVCNSKIGDTERIINEGKTGFVCTDFDQNNYEKAVKALLSFPNTKEEKTRIRNQAIAQFSLLEGSNRYYEMYETILHQE